MQTTLNPVIFVPIIFVTIAFWAGVLTERWLARRRKKSEPVNIKEEPPKETDMIIKSVTVECDGERTYESCNEFGLTWETSRQKGQLFIYLRQLQSCNEGDWRVVATLANYSIVDVEWVKFERPAEPADTLLTENIEA